MNQPADVVTEVHHPDLKPRPRDADGAHDLAAHRVLLVAEYVLDTRAHSRARRVRRLLALRQRTISCGATVDMALQALRRQARLNLHRAVGAVRPDPIAGIGRAIDRSQADGRPPLRLRPASGSQLAWLG